jgi:hypothetical protein
MKMLLASRDARGRLTVLAGLLAEICAPSLAASDIVISQVYGGGGNAGSHYRNDSAAGSSWNSNKTLIPGPFTLQPGQYLLVQEGTNPPNPAGDLVLLPAAEVTGTLSLSATTGKIALVNSNVGLTGNAPTSDSIMDLVG